MLISKSILLSRVSALNAEEILSEFYITSLLDIFWLSLPPLAAAHRLKTVGDNWTTFCACSLVFLIFDLVFLLDYGAHLVMSKSLLSAFPLDSHVVELTKTKLERTCHPVYYTTGGKCPT